MTKIIFHARKVLIALALLAAGCLPTADSGLFDDPFAPPTATPAPILPTQAPPTEAAVVPEASATPAEPTPAATPDDRALLGETATYRDEFAGFEIDYPAGWHVTDVPREVRATSTSYAITFTSWAPEGAGTDGIPEGGSKIDVVVFKSGATTLDEAVALQREQMAAGDPPETILSEDEWTLEGGLQVVHWRVVGLFAEASLVVTAHNGSTLMVSGLGDFNLTDAIARTLRVFPVAS